MVHDFRLPHVVTVTSHIFFNFGSITGSHEASCLKPATGRPYVRAFSLSGTVPAFTCDCLRFVCAFTPRPKVDLCVSTSSRTIDSIHARAIIGRKRGLAGIGTKLVGVKLFNTLQQVSKLTSTN